MHHVDEDHIFRSEAARHNNLLAVSLDSSHQYILGLLRLERSAPGFEFCN
jgi:hypothetical protein